jgi:hypothetical protein
MPTTPLEKAKKIKIKADKKASDANKKFNKEKMIVVRAGKKTKKAT